METHWETQLAQLLARLAAAQQELLALLSTKSEFLKERDHEGLASLQPREESILAELQECFQQRQQLLEEAGEAGMPADSIRSLMAALPRDSTQTLQRPLDTSIKQSLLLRHQSVAQWVFVQRTILHLSNMLEIIATGGRPEPTYGERGARESSGALMDQAA